MIFVSLTIHPPKAFAGDQLKVYSLIPILGIHQMGQLDCVKLRTKQTLDSRHSAEVKALHLLRHDAVKVDESRGHPDREQVSSSVETGIGGRTCRGIGTPDAALPLDNHNARDQPMS